MNELAREHGVHRTKPFWTRAKVVGAGVVGLATIVGTGIAVMYCWFRVGRK